MEFNLYYLFFQNIINIDLIFFNKIVNYNKLNLNFLNLELCLILLN